jgi:glycosyltransferase involved in cell wall biosynthesis
MKILEAMALGLPVLTTTVGIQGIQVQPQVEIAVADGASAFSQALSNLLASPEKQKELALAARVFIEKNHDAKLQTQQLLDRFLMA